MASKKIKRALARMRHEEFMEEYRRSGLEAQRKDRSRRERQNYQAWEEKHKEKHSEKKPVEECPWCLDILKAKKRRDSEFDAVLEKQGKAS